MAADSTRRSSSIIRMNAASQPVSRAVSPTNNRSSSNLPNFGGSQPVNQGVNNMQKNFQNMYKDLN